MAILTDLADIRSSYSSGGISGALGTVSTTVSGVPIVGQAVGLLAGILSGLKGGTQHLAYEQADPLAWKAKELIYPKFQRAYADSGCKLIAQKIPARWIPQLTIMWGLDSNLNQNIKREIEVNGPKGDLGRLIWAFFLWTYVNSDAERIDQTVIGDLFQMIFVQATVDAGMDATRLDPDAVSGDANAATSGDGIPSSGTDKATGDKAAGKDLPWLYIGIAAVVLVLVFIVSRGGE